MRRRNESFGIANTIKTLMKWLVFFLAGSSVVRGMTDRNSEYLLVNRPKILNNPYGDPLWCGVDKNVPPNSRSECHAFEEQTFYPIDQRAPIITTNCLRKLTPPSSKCYKTAVSDGTRALMRGDDITFQRIMQSYSIKDRKKFHDAVMRKIRLTGENIISNMPSYDSDLKPQSEREEIAFGPFRKDPI